VTGAVFKTTKGAPHVILKLVKNCTMVTQVCVYLLSFLLLLFW